MKQWLIDWLGTMLGVLVALFIMEYFGVICRCAK